MTRTRTVVERRQHTLGVGTITLIDDDDFKADPAALEEAAAGSPDDFACKLAR
jgi:hypothetical protein